jgi:Flp pilus assembly protein TadG
MMWWNRKAWGSDSGASALEFAVILPVFLLMLFGMIEFGFAFQGQLAVTHAAREGARLAAVNKWDQGKVASRAYPLSGGGLSVVRVESADSVRVTVSYPYQPRILSVLPEVTLSSSAVMRREY